MKKLIFGVLAVSAIAFAFAATQSTQATAKASGGCCKAEAKVVAKAESGCCKSKAVQAKAEGMDCSGGVCKPAAKVVAQVEKDCAGGACADKMEAKAEGKCCKSTAAKPIAKAGKGCCNEPGQMAKFKVFVDGKWMFYGCRGSADKGRRELVAMAFRVGQVQPVTGRVLIPRNQSLL